VRGGAAGLADCLLEVNAVAVVVSALITGDGGMIPVAASGLTEEADYRIRTSHCSKFLEGRVHCHEH
jgi:hypothetical protein